MSEEDSASLVEEVSEDEPKDSLHTFHKDKSPGPDGWGIELFISLYEHIGADLLAVVEESRHT